MWLLITFILLWALTPGPVTVMTIHKAKKEGAKAGISIAFGATITAVLMVIIALLVYRLGFQANTDILKLMWLERIGALGIILMGCFAGYKSIRLSRKSNGIEPPPANNHMGIMQGIMLMATGIPQAVMFYTVIVPQAVDADRIIPIILALGCLKVFLIFAWHSLVALMATNAQHLLNNRRVGKGLDFATACLMIGLGVNILV